MKPGVIDYESLVTEYEESLVTVLRGFRPSVGFLDTWVPDEDPAKSILNVFEAAALEGEPDVVLFLGRETVARLNVADLRALLSGLGRVDVTPEAAGLLLHVSMSSPQKAHGR